MPYVQFIPLHSCDYIYEITLLDYYQYLNNKPKVKLE